jgi:uncharacterized protein YndB with AHSA1/START domain
MTLDPTGLQAGMVGETDYVVRRDFTHPPARVWRALTEPALIRQWIGSGDLIRCEMDLRPGGSFLYEWKAFYFSGPILAVDAPHHFTHVQHFNGDTTKGPTVMTDLVAHGSGTRMTVVMRYADSEARAAAIAEGFTHGVEEVYGGIEDVLAAG